MSQGYASAGILLDPTYGPWTATLANLTQGDGTIVSRFRWGGTPGGLVTAHFIFTLGSTSAVGTDPTISVPVTASSDYVADKNYIGGAVLDDSGSETLTGMVRLGSSTLFVPSAFVSSGTHMRQSNLTAAIPFTWASGDILAFSAEYEAA